MRINLLITVFVSTLLIGCKSQITQAEYETPRIENVNIPVREYSILAVLWQQHAAEYRALAYQAFNIAQMKLDDILNHRNEVDSKIPLAIVTDIDETILNNSAYNGKMIELGEDCSKVSWLEWGKEKKAKAVPGALSFFKYAKSKEVDVYFCFK